MSTFAAVLITCLPISVYGQSKPSVVIDGVGITLGEPEQVVLAKLGKDHRVQKVEGLGGEGVEAWGVLSKRDLPLKYFGDLFFVQGKLAQARVSWASPTDRGALEFARAVLGALSTAANELGAPCTVSVRKAEVPGATHNFANIHCGTKTVGISLATSYDGKFASGASVSEEVGSLGQSAVE